MTKEQIAGILEQIATLLELKVKIHSIPRTCQSFKRWSALIEEAQQLAASLGRPDHGQILFQLEEQEAKGQDERVTSLRSL